MISQGLATPVTGSRAVGTDKDSMRSFLDLVSPDSTPTPLRFRDAMPQGDFSDSLLTDLLNMFQEEHTLLTESSKARLKDFCVEHSRRTSGLLQARDIVRKRLVARENKILELQQRITTLEAELDTERAVVRFLREEE